MNWRTTALYLIAAGLLNACSESEKKPSSVDGRLVDSPVGGVHYSGSGHTGLTDDNGKFQYFPGEKIRFSIGGIDLGEVTGAPVLTPLELVSAPNIDHISAINLARFLQSIDEDANASNGITVSPDTRISMQGWTIDFAQSESGFESDAGVLAALDSVEPNRTLISASSARSHLAGTLAQIGRTQDACPTTPCVEFVRVWSDQVPGIEFNLLPGMAGSSGSDYRINKIHMGVRENGFGYVKAEISVIGISDDSGNLKVRLAQVPNGVGSGIGGAAAPLVGEGTFDGRVASMRVKPVDLDLLPDDYHVAVWLDDNNDNSWQANEKRWTSEYRVMIVTEHQGKEFVARMGAKIALAEIFKHVSPVPRATIFAQAFLENDPIVLDSTYNPETIRFRDIEPILQRSLSYNVGLDHSSGVAEIKNFSFPSSSGLAADVIRSDAFQALVKNQLNRNSSAIAQAASGNGGLRIALPGGISYPGDAGVSVLDLDLHFVFNDATLIADLVANVSCQSDLVHFDSVKVEGRLIDLYDFNYLSRPPDFASLTDGHKMSLVQAGFGTMHQRGQIFRTEVRLNGEVAQPLPTDIACSSGEGNNGPWIGEWIQTNFLGDDDNGIWDEDNPDGIGFVASIDADSWTEIDEDGNGCAVTYSYSVDERFRYSKVATAVKNCPFPLGPFLNETGSLVFSNGNTTMDENFDPFPGDTLLAFRWQRR